MDEPVKLSDLSWVDRLRYLIDGKVYLRHRRKRNWSGSLPFYLVRCKIHGPFEDYPYGHDEYFSCPECYAALLEKHEEEDSQ